MNLTVGEYYAVDLIHNRDLVTFYGVCEAIDDNAATFRPLHDSTQPYHQPIAIEVPYTQIIYTEVI